MKATKPRKVKPVVSPFTISLSLGTLHYEGTGVDAISALRALPKPPKMFLKGVVRISNGTKTREIPYTPYQVKRLFFPMAQKIIAKQLSTGMV